MKKSLFALILMATFTASAQEQHPNPRLRQLEEFFQQKGFGVSHQQTNAIDGSITHMLHSYPSQINLYADFFPEDMSEEDKQRIIHEYDSINALRRQFFDEVLDSIRTTFALLSKDASESYMYEYHKNGVDTIMYSLAFQRENDSLYSSRFGNRVHFANSREAVNFDFHRGYNKGFGGIEGAGNFNHSYSIPTGMSWDDMLQFDTIAFSAHIRPVLKKFKKLKGAKTYPVYWRHDEGFDDDIKGDGGLVLKIKRFGAPSFGLTTGTHYFIPSRHQAEAEALYRQLDSLAYNYVTNHPEQVYKYTFTSRFPYLNMRNIVEGTNFKDDNEYYLSCMRDRDNNYHILTLNNKGNLWVPKDWEKLKSYINGEKVNLKGMKPTEDD